MIKNVLEKDPSKQDHSATVMIGEEGASQLTPELLFKDMIFTNGGPPTEFVKNITTTPAHLIGDPFKGRPIKPPIGGITVR